MLDDEHAAAAMGTSRRGFAGGIGFDRLIRLRQQRGHSDERAHNDEIIRTRVSSEKPVMADAVAACLICSRLFARIRHCSLAIEIKRVILH